MSRTPVSASLDGYVIVASHLSSVPSMATEALTANRTELPSFVIWITGISAAVCASIPSAKNTRLTQTAALGKKFIDYYLHFLMAIRWHSVAVMGEKGHASYNEPNLQRRSANRSWQVRGSAW